VTDSTRAVAAMQVHSVARILTFDAGDSDGKKIKVPAGTPPVPNSLRNATTLFPFPFHLTAVERGNGPSMSRWVENDRNKNKGVRPIINLPPRHLKSHLASVAFPAWCLGHNPSAQILCVSYAQELADKLSRDCRRIVASDWYRKMFPTRLSPQRQAMSEFETTAQGCRIATSVGGVLTGRGADIIIIDDPLKPEEALSEAHRQAANEWFDHTLYSQLNDKHTGAIILIMHRLHEDDLAGHVLGQEDWEIVRLPAIAEEDETIIVDNPLGQRCFERRRGEALHPAREPLPMLEQIRRTIGEYNFAGQYQQAPVAIGRRARQGSLVPAVRSRGDTAVRAHRAELGYREQGDRAQRLQRVHELGDSGQEPLSDRRVAAAHGIPRAKARRARAIRAVSPERRIDRGQGLGDPADPGADRRRPLCRDPLPAAI
jgi:hypothetical protein